MIQHDIKPSVPLQHTACGNAAKLIESRGRALIDHRLFGKPATQYHVECVQCGVATPPFYSALTAEHIWRWPTANTLVQTTDLPALRVQAERSLLAA